MEPVALWLMASSANAYNMESKDTKAQAVSNEIVYLILGALLGIFCVDVIGVGNRFAVLNSILATAGMSALGSYFLNFCYQPGAIFGWYMDMLDVYFRDNPKNPFGFLYSPLGGCMYCQNTWLTIASFILLKGTFAFSWWMILPTIFLSHFILTIVNRILDR